MTRTDAQKERRQFNKVVEESSIDEPIKEGKFHPLCRTLQIWSEIHGFESVAANVKWCVSYWNANEYRDDEGRHRSSHARHATLLRCFGQVFKGSEVGILGADIVGGVLRRSYEIRQAGILTLEDWCEDDEDGTWLTMMAEHREREKDPVLKDYCTQVLDNYEWGVGDPEDEETMESKRPILSLYQGQELGPDDLTFDVSEVIGCPEGENLAEIHCTVFYIDDGGDEWIIGAKERTPVNHKDGHYYAALLVPITATPGNYRIRWTFKEVFVRTHDQDFLVRAPTEAEIADSISSSQEVRDALRTSVSPSGHLISKEEHQEFLDVAEKYRDNVISGHISTERVPKFLEDNLGIHPHLTLDLLESHKIEKVSTRPTNLHIIVGRMHPAASQVVLFAWTPTWAFSMTTHEKSDWLVGIFS